MESPSLPDESGNQAGRRRAGFLERLRARRRRIHDSILEYRKPDSREGLTLVDIALALTVAAVMTTSVTAFVADGQSLQLEADRLTVAVTLAQSKLAQLLSNPYGSNEKQQGKFGDDAGFYAGYEWEWEIKEGEIDIADVQASGQLKSSVPVEDEMPAGVRNKSAGPDSMGTGTKSETGGKIKIFRIVVKITYPRGGGQKGEYRVETFRGAKNTT